MSVIQFNSAVPLVNLALIRRALAAAIAHHEADLADYAERGDCAVDEVSAELRLLREAAEAAGDAP